MPTLVFSKLLIMVIFFTSVSYARSSQELVLGYIEFPPFTYTNQHGSADGTLLKEAQKIIEQAGFQVNTIHLPAARLKKHLEIGEVDLWLGIKPPKDLEDKVLLGKQKLSTIRLNLYSLLAKEAIDIADLKGQEVIVIRGYSYGGVIDYLNDSKNNIKIHETHDHAAAFKMLAKKRANYLLAYQKPSDLALQQLTIDKLKVNNLSTLPIYFIVSKRDSNAKAVLATLEHLLIEDIE